MIDGNVDSVFKEIIVSHNLFIWLTVVIKFGMQFHAWQMADNNENNYLEAISAYN